MKKMNESRGITLIALVVTIIVLLILAAVSITSIVGENGIITKAKDSSQKTRDASIEEARDLWIQERQIAEASGEEPKTLEELLDELKNQNLLSEDEVDEIINSADNSIKIGTKTISFSLIEKVEPEVISDWEWEVNEDGNTVTLIAYNGADTDVIVPNYIDGMPVKGIKAKSPAQWKNGSVWGPTICSGNYNGIVMGYTPKQNTITSVTISEGIQEIGYFCFAGSQALVEVKIPNTVKKIDRQAFAWCTSLEKIDIPASVSEIYGNTFVLSSSLREINVDENNINYKDIDGVLYNKTGTELIRYPEGKTNESFVIPNHVETVKTDSFSGYSSALANLYIPKTVTSMESHIFSTAMSAVINVEYLEEEIPDTWNESWSKTWNGYSNNSYTIYYGITIPTN